MSYAKKYWAEFYKKHREFIHDALKESCHFSKPWNEGPGLELVELVRNEIGFPTRQSNKEIYLQLDKMYAKDHTQKMINQSKLK